MNSKNYILFILLASFFFTSCQKDSLTTETLATSEDSELTFRKSFPDLISLPDGFKPEGIVAGTGTDFYVGSLEDGSIYKGDFRTGEGEIWYTPDDPAMAVGLAFDNRTKYLYVAGGGYGGAYVIDTQTGEQVMGYSFGGGFVNDVIVTQDGAYFTDSFTENFYRIPLSPGGYLPDASEVEAIGLSGDYTFIPGNFNANGIETLPNGSTLIIINSTAGELYLVDKVTGNATLIDLIGDVTSGDGILLQGKDLFVVRNFLEEIAVVEMSSDFLSGEVVETITDPDFQIPTTVTRHGNKLYVVNARFDVAPPDQPADNIAFDVVLVD